LQLTLLPDHWLTVADELRRGHFHVRVLSLGMIQGAQSEDTEAVKAVASATRSNPPLEHLTLEMETGFTDEVGVALAEALTFNKTLCCITLSDDSVFNRPPTKFETLGVPAYEAFSAMLRVNTSIDLNFPPFDSASSGDESLRKSHDQMRIEQRLNYVGRGELLSSSQTTKGEWVDALHELDSCGYDESPTFQVSCLYSLLQLDPGMCFGDANNSGE
jgi:hypothetical protein